MNLKKCVVVVSLGVAITMMPLGAGQAVATNFTAPQQLVRLGMRGDHVQVLQAKLKEVDYFHVNPTGYFGPITDQSVKQFQQAKGLVVDGIVGQQTWMALENSVNRIELPSRGTVRPEGNSYTVQRGDTLWGIAQTTNTTVNAIVEWNNLNSTVLVVGQNLVIPINGQLPSRGGELERVQSKYGELLSWFGQADNFFPRDGTATVIDVETGISFQIMRTGGYNHADCETLTLRDTQIMRSLYGGSWSWQRRAVIVEVGGRRIAASLAGMPHAGRDDMPWGVTVSNRSGGYGTGINLDKIKGNGMDGHFDIHFLNSRTHGSNRVDPQHQAMVQKAAGN